MYGGGFGVGTGSVVNSIGTLDYRLLLRLWASRLLSHLGKSLLES